MDGDSREKALSRHKRDDDAMMMNSQRLDSTGKTCVKLMPGTIPAQTPHHETLASILPHARISPEK